MATNYQLTIEGPPGLRGWVEKGKTLDDGSNTIVKLQVCVCMLEYIDTCVYVSACVCRMQCFYIRIYVIVTRPEGACN